MVPISTAGIFIVFGLFLIGLVNSSVYPSEADINSNNNNSTCHHHRHSFTLSRRSFPTGFIFGTASSAYQYEGAAEEEGRGSSIWDTFTHNFPDKITDRSNGDVAVDSYHRYKEDVGIMKEMGLDAYRFSVSWSRILPNGKVSGGVNKEGIRYYNNLINELISNGMQPFVTLFHWDLPQALEDEYNGFLSSRIVDDFKGFAELCYREFGDRVKHWITLNEPWTYAYTGYALGNFAPGRCSKWVGNCSAGHSGVEPYLVGHYQLLAHAAAAKLYKDNFQAFQRGKIGITLVSLWVVPYSDAKSDQNAAERAMDFMYGWFMDPLVHGDYPHKMRSLVGDRLPKFTDEQSKLVKGSFDFIGLNYYTANYAVAAHVPYSKNKNNTHNLNSSFTTDARAKLSAERKGVPIGAKTGSSWLFVYPRGIKDLLLYTKNKYNNPVIYITENGVSELDHKELSLEAALKDNYRIDYYDSHLLNLEKAIKEGVDVRGYFAWSLLDNFEWGSGYTVRFGINYVDYRNGLKRHPKQSATWFKNFLHPKTT